MFLFSTIILTTSNSHNCNRAVKQTVERTKSNTPFNRPSNSKQHISMLLLGLLKSSTRYGENTDLFLSVKL
ncbi:hypothetical protein GJ496_010376 [Pomphorhynchus laevis]|nr:hypothetical protein GJ496_010376 [Pomphorhynchus laevis]